MTVAAMVMRAPVTEMAKVDGKCWIISSRASQTRVESMEVHEGPEVAQGVPGLPESPCADELHGAAAEHD